MRLKHSSIPPVETANRKIRGSHRLGSVAVDSILAVCLIGAIAVVYAVDRVTPEPVGPKDGIDFVEETNTEPETNVPKSSLRLAVTPPEFDDMGKLLDQLGKGYRYTSIELDDLVDEKVLAKYDVVFVTCGTVPDYWLGEVLEEGPRNTIVREMKDDIGRQLQEKLRFFVRGGGTLYASDWRFDFVRLAFPELVDQSSDEVGMAQEVDATVVDDGLRELIGNNIQLRFDLGSWYPAIFAVKDVKIYLEGRFQTTDGTYRSAPLLVRVPFGEGAIVFTSFHNEKQNSESELSLLKYLVFATVTARLESQVAETMLKGGFSPQKQNLLTTSSGEPSVTKTYHCTKAGHLQFVLAFEDQGATLGLSVLGPNGQKHDKEGASTLRIDITDAEIGDWQYTITAHQVPYQNFPFTLTVWQR